MFVTVLGAADSFVTNTNFTGEATQPLPIAAENSNFAYGAGIESAYYPQTTVDMGVYPGEQSYQSKTTEQVGFFDVIRSLTNVFTGLVGRVNSPATVEYSPMGTPAPIESEILLSQHSEEDTADEDTFDDRVISSPVAEVPISVRLAKVKQLVKSHFAPQSRPNFYDGYPQYAPVEIHDPMSQVPASVHSDGILMPGEHVSENFGCNSRICLLKK